MTPKGLLSKPTLWQSNFWVWAAYSALDRTRQSGMGGPEPITFSEMNAYFQVAGEIDVEDRMRLVKGIQALDLTYLEFVVSRMDKKK